MAPEGDDPESKSEADSLLRAVATAPERTPEAMPDRIAHFRIVGRLGEGGMGIVYRAEDETLKRMVALKVLPEAFAQDEERRRRFLREARSAAALTHANIATVYEIDEDAGRVFIAMELVEGPTLREKLAAGRMAERDTVRIARGIARGLARAHAKGIVHRDLKPDNVAIDADGEAKILDFGLAKLREVEAPEARSALEHAETASVVTEHGQTLGTPQYMSPEQTRGEAVDGRSDVFSLGVVLYEMCAGRRPFKGTTTVEILASILRDTPEPLRSVAPEVRPELAAIVDRCLAKAPAQRWPGARELLEALEALPTSGSVKSQVGVNVAPQRPRSFAWPVAALLVVIAGVAGVELLVHRKPVETPATAATSPSTAPSAHIRTITEWPPPKTSSPEAATLYAEALQALHDASINTFSLDMDRAVALDPHFAAAHVRRALLSLGVDDTRRHVAAATQARASLDPRDQRLLALADAMSRDLTALEPRVKAAHDLADALPDDPEAVFWAAMALSRTLGEYADARKLLNQTLELDPSFAVVEHERAVIAGFEGDPDAELAAVARCVALQPGATACIRRRADTHDALGQCAELEADAREIIAIEPNGFQGYGYLETALAARGAPVEGLRDLASKVQAAGLLAGFATRTADQDGARLALYTGDFVASEAGLLALQKDEANLTDESEHLAEAQLFELYDEDGEGTKAAAVAEDYLRRMPAWIHDQPAWSRAGALAVLRRTGRLSDSQAFAMRDAWLAEWRPMVPARSANRAWHWFYAEWAATPSEGREAVAALPPYTPLPQSRTQPALAGDEGRAYALAGDADRAIPLLRKAVAWCGAVPTGGVPIAIRWLVDAMHDRLLLGQMLEQKGDHDGACAQYAAVLARWGNAKPRSVTADKARARSKALACGP